VAHLIDGVSVPIPPTARTRCCQKKVPGTFDKKLANRQRNWSICETKLIINGTNFLPGGFVLAKFLTLGLTIYVFTAGAQMNKTVLVPVPHYGFDPTESAVPWKILKAAGVHIVFATPDGKVAAADRRMVTGDGLPAILKSSLMATPDSVETYREMEASDEFQNPISYDQIQPQEYDGLMLPGGHDKGMREYLESPILQRIVAYFFDHDKIVGAICHGTLLAGRSVSLDDPSRTGRSVLWGRKTTGLTRNQELIAYQLTRLVLGDYYRTYSVPMEDELVSYLESPNDFSSGPGIPIPLKRDTDDDLSAGFTVRDGKYLSARWPGDAHLFGHQFVDLLNVSR
jgi:protease I